MTDRTARVLDARDERPRFADALAVAAEVEVEHPDHLETPLSSGDVAICFDPHSLEIARTSEARGVAMLPSFDLRWRAGFDAALEEADRVLCAHEALVAALPERARSKARVCGPLAPPGFVGSKDRGALREELGLHRPTVLVTAVPLMEAVGATPLLMQLGLAKGPLSFLFDVGLDAEVAGGLRALAPQHELDAYLFAHTDDAARYYQSADLVLTVPRSEAVSMALGVGAGLVLLSGGEEPEVLRALEPCASDAGAVATLAVALDDGVERRFALRGVAADYDASGNAERALAMALDDEATSAKPDSRSSLPPGLPKGLERVGEGRAASPEAHDEPPSTDDDDDAPSLDDRIEAELAALKKSLE